MKYRESSAKELSEHIGKLEAIEAILSTMHHSCFEEDKNLFEFRAMVRRFIRQAVARRDHGD